MQIGPKTFFCKCNVVVFSLIFKWDSLALILPSCLKFTELSIIHFIVACTIFQIIHTFKMCSVVETGMLSDLLLGLRKLGLFYMSSVMVEICEQHCLSTDFLDMSNCSCWRKPSSRFKQHRNIGGGSEFWHVQYKWIVGCWGCWRTFNI